MIISFNKSEGGGGFDPTLYYTKAETDAKISEATSGLTASIAELQSQIASLQGSGFLKANDLSTVNGNKLYLKGVDIKFTSVPEINTIINYKVNNGQIVGPESGETFGGLTVISNTVTNNNGVMMLDGTLTTLPYGAYQNVTELVGIELPDSITYLDSDSLRESGIEELSIPNNASLGYTVAYGCANLAKVVFNGNNEMNGNDFAFSFGNATDVILDCTNSTKYKNMDGCLVGRNDNYCYLINPKTGVVPEGVIKMLGGSCSGYGWLETIDLPSTLTEIGNESITFNDTISIICRALVPPTMGEWQPIGYNTITDIFVPAESVDAYKAADGWSDYASVIKAMQ